MMDKVKLYKTVDSPLVLAALFSSVTCFLEFKECVLYILKALVRWNGERIRSGHKSDLKRHHRHTARKQTNKIHTTVKEQHS